jgi:NADH-quinone oxidoreductase subunit E
MTFSPELEARFAKLLNSYPPGRQRSAVIPMLLYAQDEVGAVTDELVDEVARRVGVTPLQVNEVVGYYSMLHRKPLGKYHVQVCTNISCLLWAATSFGSRPATSSASAIRKSRPTGRFRSKKWNASGACSWAPAVQVNYDFYHDVTPEKLDKLLDGLRKEPEEISNPCCTTNQSRSKSAVLTRRFGLPNSRRSIPISRTTATRRSKRRRHDARADHRRGEGLQPARTRRRGFPHRDEVELRAAHSRPSRSTSWSTPTRASRAPAKTAC